jgi:hypothetical protein
VQIRTGDEAARLPVEPGLLDADTIAVARSEADAEDAAGESVDEYILRRTKEYNVSTRERPYELNVWLQFAAFQVQPRLMKGWGCEWGTCKVPAQLRQRLWSVNDTFSVCSA